MMRRLHLLYRRNRLRITPWLQRSVLSFSFHQTAPYCTTRSSTGLRYDEDSPLVFKKSESLGDHLLLDGKLDENRVVSPWSFQLVLNLLAAGSDSSARRQLLTFFNTGTFVYEDPVECLNSIVSLLSDVILVDCDPVIGPRMRCSNGLWVDQSLPLRPSFKHILDSDYRAALNPVDFHTKIYTFQKSFMQVNEQGTQAATATVAIVMSGPPPCLPPVPPISLQPYPLHVYSGTDEYGDICASKTKLFVEQVIDSPR